MKTAIRHGSVLKCDYPKCKAQFVSYSVASMVRKQASSKGWARVWAWQITKGDSPALKKDVCDDHAPIAAVALADREETLAAERAEAKAKRAELRAAKGEVIAAERAKKKADREAVKAAKAAVATAELGVARAQRKADRDTARVAKDEQRKIDRAKKKAAKLSIEVHGAVIHVERVPDDDDQIPESESGATSPYPVGGA